MFASSSSSSSSMTSSSVALFRAATNKSKSSSSSSSLKRSNGYAQSTSTMARCNYEQTTEEESNETNASIGNTTAVFAKSVVAASLAVGVSLASPFAALADRGTEVRLPPIDNDPNRCERAFVGNTIGQANAVSDKTLDLRKCEYDNVSVKGITLSGALMVDSVFDNSDFSETVMSKVYATNASFKNVNFTNAVIDRATFDGSNMTGANFQNAVLTGVSYEGADLTGANFEEALIGDQDVKLLCLNPTVVDESRMQIGCKN